MKFLISCSLEQILSCLQEPAFQRLIFITMLAWENPYGDKNDLHAHASRKASFQVLFFYYLRSILRLYYLWLCCYLNLIKSNSSWFSGKPHHSLPPPPPKRGRERERENALAFCIQHGVARVWAVNLIIFLGGIEGKAGGRRGFLSHRSCNFWCGWSPYSA